MIERHYSILGSEYFRDIDGHLIDEIVKKESYSKELVYNSNNWSSALKNYLILTHKPTSIKNIELNELSILMSRYYWFKKFYFEYSQSNGIDAGIEQQISLIIELIGNRFKDFDWNEIQKIDQSIEIQT
jgi:hypothetical protein